MDRTPEPERPAGSRPTQDYQNLVLELSSTRTYMQRLVEELRSANEEAQSSNEELQSTNEELQTAKEELQSSNEELTTTNEEMRSRNSELNQLNNDLVNLLSSLQVPIVMLNDQLRIRRYTPVAEKVLNLIPIRHWASHFGPQAQNQRAGSGRIAGQSDRVGHAAGARSAGPGWALVLAPHSSLSHRRKIAQTARCCNL